MHDELWMPELYADLEPTWKLASRIITNPSQLPYWDAIRTAAEERKADKDDGQELEDSPTFFSEEILSPERTAEVLELIEHLVRRVQFLVGDPGDMDAFHEAVEIDSSEELASLFPDAAAGAGEYSSLGANDNFIGSITIDKGVIDDVRNWDAVGRTIEETRLKTVHLAGTIGHELIHLACDFLTGDQRWWFNDEDASETGLAYENFTFGGLLRQDTDKQRLYLESWPSHQIWKTYADDISRPIELRDEVDATHLRQEKKRYVPDHDWVQLFNESHGTTSDKPMEFSKCCDVVSEAGSNASEDSSE